MDIQLKLKNSDQNKFFLKNNRGGSEISESFIEKNGGKCQKNKFFPLVVIFLFCFRKNRSEIRASNFFGGQNIIFHEDRQKFMSRAPPEFRPFCEKPEYSSNGKKRRNTGKKFSCVQKRQICSQPWQETFLVVRWIIMYSVTRYFGQEPPPVILDREIKKT